MNRTMSPNSNLVWVNKSLDSSSLSNCRTETDRFRQIRSHAVTAGHKSSRVKRPIKRKPFDLSWARRNTTKTPAPDLSSSHERGDNAPLPCFEVSRSETCSRFSSAHRPLDFPPRSDSSSRSIFSPALPLHPLSSIPDPFSCYSINFCPETLEHLWYFGNVWTQSAFKLPGCIGYGQPPIPQHEITSMMQQCLSNKTRSYCLLAATSARMQYIHHPSMTGGLTHGYAASALCGLRGRMQKREAWEEEEATDVLFLAAYEIFCEDEAGAEKHLAAVRRLYKREIENTFMRRLQANLEILVAKSVTLRCGSRSD